MSSNDLGKTGAWLVLFSVVAQVLILVISPSTFLGFIITVIPLWLAAISNKSGECVGICNVIAAIAIMLSIVITNTESCGVLLLLHLLTLTEIIIIIFIDDSCRHSSKNETCHVHNYNICSCGKRK